MHSSKLLRSTSCVINPAGHDLQEVELVLYVFKGHTHLRELVDPASEMNPMGHDLQELPSL
jgi:hypothetical protein